MNVKRDFVLLSLLGMLLVACGSGGETAVTVTQPAATQITEATSVPPTQLPEPELKAVPTEAEIATAESAAEPEMDSDGEDAPEDVAAEPISTPDEPIAAEWVEEDVVFVAADEQEVYATFYGSRSEQGQPGVILLHMLGGNRKVWERNEFAALLADNGYAVLTVDMRGHGDTRGVQDWEAVASDLQQIWTEFVGWDEVDEARTAVVGGSIGSSMALIMADNQPTISTVVLLSPGIEYLGVPIDQHILTYGQRPMLIAASEEDTYSADSSRTLQRVAQEAELILYEGAGHGVQMFGAEPTLATSILEWLNIHLGGGLTAVSDPSVTSQDVEFTTADDRTLQGTLFGSGDKGVVFANMNDNQSLPWRLFAQEVAAAGYMTLVFEYRSAGRFGMGERDDDLLAAAHFMQEQGAESLVIIGASIGGTATAVVASEHQDALNLQGISIIASPAGVPDLIARDAMIQAITVPKLFITTENDEQGLAVSTEQMFETAVEPKEFQTYPGTAHGVDIFATESDAAFRQRLLEFVQMVMPLTE